MFYLFLLIIYMYFWETACWWRVSPERANTTTVTEKHANQEGKCSLSIHICPINEHYMGIYRWRFASQVQLLFGSLTTVIFPKYSWTYT